MTETVTLPEVVSAGEWQIARDVLLAKEKELTRAADAIAAERRRLPMVRFDSTYEFDGPRAASPSSTCSRDGVS